MTLLLDTHVWIWWVNGAGPLSPREQADIDAAALAGGVGVCVISCWEVAMDAAKGRLRLATPADRWVDLALAVPGVELVPLTPEVAVTSVSLPGAFHGDPADRFIVATARSLDVPLVTHDGLIRAYPHVRLHPG